MSASPSDVQLCRVVTDLDANQLGTVHGGMILYEIDSAAAVAAARRAGKVCVTAAIDQVSFHRPVTVGDLLYVSASVVNVGRTSLTVQVTVTTEPYGGGPQVETTTATVVMVAVDADGRPVPVGPDRSS